MGKGLHVVTGYLCKPGIDNWLCLFEHLIDMAFEGKVALVTGAASGIGAAVVAEFIRGGAFVIATDKNDVRLEAVWQNEPNVRTARLDVTSEDDWVELFLGIDRLDLDRKSVV